jgi:hypothetical protein
MKPNHTRAEAANDEAVPMQHFVERRGHMRHPRHWIGTDPRAPQVRHQHMPKPGMFESIGRLVAFLALCLLVWAAVLSLFRG